jgi:hypothetical protein
MAELEVVEEEVPTLEEQGRQVLLPRFQDKDTLVQIPTALMPPVEVVVLEVQVVLEPPVLVVEQEDLEELIPISHHPLSQKQYLLLLYLVGTH